MKKNDAVFTGHILDAISKIENYLDDISYDNFIEDAMRSDAVVRELEIIGEAAKHLSSGFRNSHKHIQWKEIAGMRDKLIHGYFGVDYQIVWNTCKEDVVILKKELKGISD